MKLNPKPVIESLNAENGKNVFSFGYELRNLNKSKTNDNVLFIEHAENWHKRFFSLISGQKFDCTVVYKIQNPNTLEHKGKPMRIAFIFYVKLIEDDLMFENIIDSFVNELSILFTPDKTSSMRPYYFVAIEEKEKLKSLNSSPNYCQLFEYHRRPVFYKNKSNGLGYGQKQTDNIFESIPQFYFPELLSLNNVLQSLSERKKFIEVNLILSPLNINYEKIRNFKQKINKSVLVDDDFTKEEMELYNKHLEKLLDDNTKLFYFKVQLKSYFNLRIGQPAHNMIADSFFGNINNTVISTPEEESLPFARDMDFEQMIPYIYSDDLILKSFRLPINVIDDYVWFPHQTNIFNYLPSELSEKGVLMGVKKMSSYEKDIRIASKDLSTHFYILGQTGVGKTTLMKTMILDQIQNGEGVCVVDPHGDLINTLHSNIPKHRQSDIIYFDPTTTKNFHINIIETHPGFPEQRSFIFNELSKLFDELYNMKEVAGPMFELYFKNALFLLIEFGHSLKQLNDFYLRKSFREQLINNSKQTDIIEFFENAERMSGEASFENIAPYIFSKTNRFTMDDFIGPIINQEKSTIDFREMMDSKKIFLVRLPKGRLGSEGAKFIGTVIFNRIIMAAYTRENISESLRTPFNLYVDEFQNFTTGDLVTALSESRKYNLKLILANQTLGQLDQKTINIILGNVGTQIFFRPGIMDIKELLPYYNKHISESELLNLPNFNAVARLMNNNMPLKPFIFETKP
jgi:hypothetical protein